MKKVIDSENSLGDTPTDSIAGMHQPDGEGAWKSVDPGEAMYSYDKEEINLHLQRLTGRKRRANSLSKMAIGLNDVPREGGKTGPYFEEDETGMFGHESPEDLPTNKHDKNTRYESSSDMIDTDLSDFSFLGFGKESNRNYKMNDELKKLSMCLKNLGHDIHSKKVDSIINIDKRAAATYSSRSHIGTIPSGSHNASIALKNALDQYWMFCIADVDGTDSNWYVGDDKDAAEAVINAAWASWRASDWTGSTIANLTAAARGAEERSYFYNGGSTFTKVMNNSGWTTQQAGNAGLGNSSQPEYRMHAEAAARYWSQFIAATSAEIEAQEEAASAGAAEDAREAERVEQYEALGMLETRTDDEIVAEREANERTRLANKATRDRADKSSESRYWYKLMPDGYNSDLLEGRQVDFVIMEWVTYPGRWDATLVSSRDINDWISSDEENRRPLVTDEFIEALSDYSLVKPATFQDGLLETDYNLTWEQRSKISNFGIMPDLNCDNNENCIGPDGFYSWDGWSSSRDEVMEAVSARIAEKARAEFGRTTGGQAQSQARSMADISGNIITDTASGNRFRSWVHSEPTRRQWAESNDFDSSNNAWNNSYMRSAWSRYGEQYRQFIQGGQVQANPGDILGGTGNVARQESQTDIDERMRAAERLSRTDVPQPEQPATVQPAAGWTIEDVQDTMARLYRGVRIGRDSAGKVRRTYSRAIGRLGGGASQQILDALSGSSISDLQSRRDGQVYNALMQLNEGQSGRGEGRRGRRRNRRASEIEGLNELTKTSSKKDYEGLAKERRAKVSKLRKKVYNSI